MIWCFGGFDPTGFSGVMKDFRVTADFKIPAVVFMTARTVQNLNTWGHFEATQVQELQRQVAFYEQQNPPLAVKIGMLPNLQQVQWLTTYLQKLKKKWPDLFVIHDPVLQSTSGGLLHQEAEDILLQHYQKLWQWVDVVTPNQNEMVLIEKYLIRQRLDINEPPCFYIKGGHSDKDIGRRGLDVYHDQQQQWWVELPDLKNILLENKRGSGCYLSTAWACAFIELQNKYACFDKQQCIKDAMIVAKQKAYNQLTQNKQNLFLPKVSSFKDLQLAFESPPDLGFYPIVDNIVALAQMVEWGVQDVQLRIKNKSQQELQELLSLAAQICKNSLCRLWINDYWQWAIEHKNNGVYGVHLGQEDLQQADTAAIHQSGLRLGLSTHSPWELSVAAGLLPSYIAMGPIYATTLKKMKFQPLGLEKLQLWADKVQKNVSIPVVAIGGISLEKAQSVLDCGVQSIAVVSDVQCAVGASQDFPQKRVQDWLNLFHSHVKASVRYRSSQVPYEVRIKD